MTKYFHGYFIKILSLSSVATIVVSSSNDPKCDLLQLQCALFSRNSEETPRWLRLDLDNQLVNCFDWTPRCTLPIAQLEEKLIAYNKKQTFDSKNKYDKMYKAISENFMPGWDKLNIEYEDQKIAVDNFMHNISLLMEIYKTELKQLDIDVNSTLQNLTILDKNNVNFDEKIEKILANATRHTKIKETVSRLDNSTRLIYDVKFKFLKKETSRIFELLTKLEMMNSTMLKLFEELEFSRNEWFQNLDDQTQKELLYQVKSMEFHSKTMNELDYVDGQLGSIRDELKKVAMIAEYSSAIQNLMDIQIRFNRLEKTNAFKLIKKSYAFQDFVSYSVDGRAYGSESSIERIFRMIFGWNAFTNWSIFEVFPKMCQRNVFESIKNLVASSIKIYSIAWSFKRGGEIPSVLQRKWAENLVNFDELYIQYCGCSSGLMKWKSGRLSKILPQLEISYSTLTENLIYISSMESLDAQTSQKLKEVLKIFNFKMTDHAIRLISSFTSEEIRIFIGMQNSPNLQFYDEKLICINGTINSGVQEMNKDDCKKSNNIKCAKGELIAIDMLGENCHARCSKMLHCEVATFSHRLQKCLLFKKCHEYQCVKDGYTSSQECKELSSNKCVE